MVERKSGQERDQLETQQTTSIMERLFPGGGLTPTKEQVDTMIANVKKTIAEEARKGPRPEEPSIDAATLHFYHDF